MLCHVSISYWDIKTDAVKLTLFLRGAFFSFAGITSPTSLRDCPATCSQPEPRLTTSGKRWRRQPTAWRSVGSVSHDSNSLGMQVLLNQRLLIQYKYNCRNEPTCELTVTAAIPLLQLSEPLAFISPPGSVVSRHVQFCGQRNRLCKLLPDGECHVSPDWDCYWMATQISCLFAENLRVCVCVFTSADRSPGRVSQKVARASSKCFAPNQSSSRWVWEQRPRLTLWLFTPNESPVT